MKKYSLDGLLDTSLFDKKLNSLPDQAPASPQAAGQQAFQTTDPTTPDYSTRNLGGEVGLKEHLIAGIHGANTAINQVGGSGSVGSNLVDTAKFIPQAIGNTLQNAWSGIGNFGQGIGNIAQGIGNAVTSGGNEGKWNSAMDQISGGGAQGIHGVAQSLSSPFVGTTQALPEVIKAPISALGGFLGGFTDSLISTGLDASGKLGAKIGGQTLSSTSDMGGNIRNIVQDIATIAMSKAGNEQAYGMIKIQPLLLNKFLSSFGEQPGMLGDLQKGAGMVNEAFQTPSSIPGKVKQGIQGISDVVGQQMGMGDSWAAPTLAKYDLARSTQFLNAMQDQSVFRDAGTKTAIEARTQVQEYVNHVTDTTLEKLNNGTFTPEDLSSTVNNTKLQTDSIFNGMKTGMSGTPVIADGLVKFLGDIAPGLQHAGNQGPLTTLTRGLIDSMGNNPTFGSIHDVYTKLSTMMEDGHPDIKGQQDFSQQLHDHLSNTLANTIKAASPEAWGALDAVRTTANNLKSLLLENIQETVGKQIDGGVDPNKALLDTVQNKVGQSHLMPEQLQQPVDQAFIKDIITKSMNGGQLDFSKLASASSDALKRTTIASDTAKFTADFLQNIATKAAKDIETGRANPEAVAAKVVNNPTPQNLQYAAQVSGVHTVNDIMNMLTKTDPESLSGIVDQTIIAKGNVNSRGSALLPEKVVGEKLNSVVDTMKAQLAEFGKQEKSLIEANKDTTIPVKSSGAKNNFLDKLANEYRISEKNGKLDFSKSDMRDDLSAQKDITNMYNHFTKKTSTIEDLDAARDNITYNMNKNPLMQTTNVDVVNAIGKEAKARLGDLLEEKIPGYRELNKNMAQIYDATEPVLKALKSPKTLDTFGLEDAKDMKSGQYLTRLSGNAGSNVRSIIEPMLKLTENFTGKNHLPEIMDLVAHGDLLKKVYGDSQANNLSNAVKSGVNASDKMQASGIGAAKEAVGGNLLGAISHLGKMGYEAITGETPTNMTNFARRFHEALIKNLQERQAKNPTPTKATSLEESAAVPTL